jgi:aspartyl aminopeptidase
MHGTAKTEIGSNLRQGYNVMLLPKIVFHIFNHHFRTKEQVRESEAVIAISRELTELTKPLAEKKAGQEVARIVAEMLD